MSRRPGLHGWGRLAVEARERVGERLDRVARAAPLTRGLGRSYGDASLPPTGRPVVAGSRHADRLLAFDGADGRLTAEAGVTLRELNRLLLPRGWFVPVSPGTQEVTLGGMVAADVHGKNHHVAGSLGSHVRGLRLQLADGRQVDCGPDREAELFWATVGGMGLTGHILEVSVDLSGVPSAWIERESRRSRSLEESIELLREAGTRWPYTVAWLDCLKGGRGFGRGIVEAGRWADGEGVPERPPRRARKREVPFEAPNWLLNRFDLALYNRFRYARHWRRRRRAQVSPDAFFYPLDGLGEWSRLYGRRGMTQYQCVLPREAGDGAVRELLELLRRSGGWPMLVVLKDFGEAGPGLLSFPGPGWTLAIDLAVGPETQSLVDTLNEWLIERAGRVYLAKDAFTRPQHFEAMEGDRLDRFRAVKSRWDPEGRILSRQWERLTGAPYPGGAGAEGSMARDGATAVTDPG